MTLLLILNGHAQSDSWITGDWDNCLQFELDTAEDCSTNAWLSYSFNQNGTYNDTYGKSGSWKLNDQVLELEEDSEASDKVILKSFEIVIVNDSLFYSVGIEGKDGRTVYHYFRRK